MLFRSRLHPLHARAARRPDHSCHAPGAFSPAHYGMVDVAALLLLSALGFSSRILHPIMAIHPMICALPPPGSPPSGSHVRLPPIARGTMPASSSARSGMTHAMAAGRPRAGQGAAGRCCPQGHSTLWRHGPQGALGLWSHLGPWAHLGQGPTSEGVPRAPSTVGYRGPCCHPRFFPPCTTGHRGL